MTSKSMDKWVEIKGFEGVYWINVFGDVKSKRRFGASGGLLKATPVKGYKQITLCKGGVKFRYDLHRLVALVFLPNPENKPHVCHRNGDSLNNEISNLYWGTAKENGMDTMLHGRTQRGEKAVNAKLNNEKVRLMRRLHEDFNWSITKIHKFLGSIYKIKHHTSWQTITRRRWNHI